MKIQEANTSLHKYCYKHFAVQLHFYSVQLNSPHITSAETEGSKPKFIQGQSLNVNLAFSVLCRGGVHTAG